MFPTSTEFEKNGYGKTQAKKSYDEFVKSAFDSYKEFKAQAQAEYDNFKEEALKNFNNFKNNSLKSANEKYAEKLAQPWLEYEAHEGGKPPLMNKPKTPPVYIPDASENVKETEQDNITEQEPVYYEPQTKSDPAKSKTQVKSANEEYAEKLAEPWQEYEAHEGVKSPLMNKPKTPPVYKPDASGDVRETELDNDNVKPDIVAGVPDSGIDAAIGYAQASGIPYGKALMINRYVGRTFIQPSQEQRTTAVRLKINVLKDAVKGKRMNKDVFRKLRQMLMEELDLSRELSDKEILDVIDELILNQIKDVRLALKEKVQLRQELFYSVRKLDVLQELVDDETVTEIMVNGPDTIFVERAGKLMKWHKSFTSAEKLEDVIQQIVGKCNRVINESMPIVDARLENGSRVNAVIYPVALNGPILTIRRFPEHPITMEKLIALGSITQECAEFLEKLVKARYSMVIGGGTGSGKTTFLAAMSEYIPRDERLITIEDNAELRIRGIDNLVRLEAKMANMEGAVSVTIRDLIKSALRMRPDRIIVGEVRGGEAMDMLQALNTGHEGSLSTAHANSARDMLSRLETMVLMGVDLPLEAIRRQIASGVDILVHLGRMRDKSRKLLEVTEVCGFENGEIRIRPLYQWQEGKGLVKTASLLHVEKLERAGIEL